MSKVFTDAERDLRVTMGTWIAKGIVGWSAAYPLLRNMELDLEPVPKDESFYWPLHTEVLALVCDEPHQPKFSACLYTTMARCELLEMHFTRNEQHLMCNKLHQDRLKLK